MKVIGVRLLGLGVAALALSLGLMLSPQARTIPESYAFTTLTGETITGAALRGKPVIVTFWATDCPACLEEIPHLLELYRRYHPRGLAIIAVAMYYDPPSHVVALAEARRLPYSVVLDLTSNHAKAFGDVALTPTTFLVNQNGEVVLQATGLFAVDYWSARIEQLLKG